MSLRTTQITVETETLTIVRRARVSCSWCQACAAEVEVVTLAADDPAAPEILRIDAVGQHHRRNPDGSVQICVRSLMEPRAPGSGQTVVDHGASGADEDEGGK